MNFCFFLILVCARPFVSHAYPWADTCLISLLLAASLPLLIFRRARLRAFSTLSIPALLFGGAIAAACLGAPDLTISLRESTRYTAGLLLFFTTLTLSDKEKSALGMALLVSSIAASAAALHQYAFGFQHLEAYCAAQHIEDAFVKDILAAKRVFAPFFNPNMLAGFLAMTAPLALLHKKTRALLLPAAGAFFLTRSIGAFASVFATATTIFLMTKHARVKKTLWLLLLAAGMTAVFWQRHADPAGFRQPGFSLEMRSRYWSETFAQIKEHPWKGVGMGSFTTSRALHAHNVFLELWAECGLAGVSAFGLFLGLILTAGAKKIISANAPPLLRSAFWGALVFLFHNLVDTTFFFLEISSTWWLLMGLLASLSLNAESRPETTKTA